ncbi:MAG: DUF4105 domain-containing protein [Microscillaceae bacterium]|nr:DUF4105 domain-containing protein [Microscillaceae bacterium]
MSKFFNSLFGFVFFCLLSFSLARAQSFGISDRAQVSLITGSPGADLYALFGHSAIRVYDPATGIDLLYNYGTFDFDTKHFYLKFAQRRLDYFLSISNYQQFVSFYAGHNRSVYEQVLYLNPEQTQALYAFLQNNYLPQNRNYLYDFFYDNCSSRIRDVFKQVFKEDIQFSQERDQDKKTFRNLIDPYQHDPWVQLGLYLLLGTPTDQVASAEDYMFLPDYLMEAFDKAKIRQGGQFIPLVSEKKTVFQAIVSKPKQGIFTPYWVFWLFFAFMAGLTYLEYRRNTRFRIVDFILFSVVGWVGILFGLMWIGTDHLQVAWNLNMLWALPTHAGFALFTWKKNPSLWMKRYCTVTSVILGLTLLAWYILPQQLHPALIPLMLVLLGRSLLIMKGN